MKYWRGYLVAVIIGAITCALILFANANHELVDMVAPYMTRLVVSYLADWSAGTSVCLWQAFLLLLGAGLLAGIVLMIVLRWNPVQFTGWVLAAVSALSFLHTALYGLNYYAGSIADDIQLSVAECTVSELNDAAKYFQTKANELAVLVERDEEGKPVYPEFEELAVQAAEGFKVLTYERSKSVFAGSTAPVKKLGWSKMYTAMGVTGITVSMTGEAAVNPNAHPIGLPFIMCRQMANRMSIVADDDANFAAFLACEANSSVAFKYSAYFMAYRYCYRALAADTTSTATACISELNASISPLLSQDMADYTEFYSNQKTASSAGIGDQVNNFYMKLSDKEPCMESYVAVTDLLVSWHVQEFVLPMHEDDEVIFDPLDETQVKIPGLATPSK